MPQGESEVNHTAITDHRIPRRPSKATPAVRRSTPGPADLVPFHRHLIPADDPEQPRNLGLALISMLDRGLPDDVARGFATAALPLLDQAVARDRHDWPAVEARADALWLLGRKDEAMRAYEAALAARPESEGTLLGAGNLALDLNQREAARGYFERAVRVNPHRALYYHRLAVASFRLAEWERAVTECRQVLRLEPTADDTRRLLVLSYLMDGRKAQALAEYDTLRHLTPDARRAELAKWFDEEQQRARR
jgi:tetratricopeptide (TPR) repeat protein